MRRIGNESEIKKGILFAAAAALVMPIIAGMIGAPAIRAQSQSQEPPTFDAVSIRPNKSGLRVSGERNSDGRLVFSNATPSRLIQLAYGVQGRTIIGPDSLSSDRYDLTATVTPPLTPAQMLPMLQAVLADRFALRSHTEMRTLPVYALRIAKGGSKLQPADAPAGANVQNVKCDPPGNRGLAEITGEFDMPRLADTLAGTLDLPVVDATGLSGAYNVCLGFAPNRPGVDASMPDLFEALRDQLGLYLASEKASVKVLVIDHIERATPN
jgi:uncharacterized protein (TIGR03435 family)